MTGIPQMPALQKSFLAKKETVRPEWYLVDGDAQIVGRLAVQIATVLMGKHKPGYTPHVDTGDYVVVTNVERICFTGKDLKHPKHPYFTRKMANKEYQTFSGYAAGQKIRTAAEIWERFPERILQEAVRRMLPKNKLARHMLDKLKMYAGPEHPHQAQDPKPIPEHLLPKKKRKTD